MPRYWIRALVVALLVLVSAGAGRAEVEISHDDQTVFCAMIAQGKLDACFEVLDKYDTTFEDAWNSINCHPLRARTELPGIDPMSWMVKRTKVNLAYQAILDMIDYFEDEPTRARFFANSLFCKHNVEVRCGRTCFRYVQRDVFEEIAHESEKSNEGTRKTYREVEGHLRDHLERFDFGPEDHDPDDCPAYHRQRRNTE